MKAESPETTSHAAIGKRQLGRISTSKIRHVFPHLVDSEALFEFQRSFSAFLATLPQPLVDGSLLKLSHAVEAGELGASRTLYAALKRIRAKQKRSITRPVNEESESGTEQLTAIELEISPSDLSLIIGASAVVGLDMKELVPLFGDVIRLAVLSGWISSIEHDDQLPIDQMNDYMTPWGDRPVIGAGSEEPDPYDGDAVRDYIEDQIARNPIDRPDDRGVTIALVEGHEACPDDYIEVKSINDPGSGAVEWPIEEGGTEPRIERVTFRSADKVALIEGSISQARILSKTHLRLKVPPGAVAGTVDILFARSAPWVVGRARLRHDRLFQFEFTGGITTMLRFEVYPGPKKKCYSATEGVPIRWVISNGYLAKLSVTTLPWSPRDTRVIDLTGHSESTERIEIPTDQSETVYEVPHFRTETIVVFTFEIKGPCVTSGGFQDSCRLKLKNVTPPFSLHHSYPFQG